MISTLASISQKAKIGKNNTICQGVVIYDDVSIGDNNYISEYVVIGSPPESRTSGKKGQTVIGDNNVIREFVAIQAPYVRGETRIGDNCYIMEKTHIAHDCQLGDNVTVSPGAVLGGTVTLCDNANIGINASIHPRIKIERFCMIGMGANITKPPKAFKTVVGLNKEVGWNIHGMNKSGCSVESIAKTCDMNVCDVVKYLKGR